MNAASDPGITRLREALYELTLCVEDADLFEKDSRPLRTGPAILQRKKDALKQAILVLQETA